MRFDLAAFDMKSGWANRCAMRYFTLWTRAFKRLYTRFDGFSTPVTSFWLICTTRRWDRGSVWGHTLFLSELIFLASMRNPIFLVAQDQASIPGVNSVLSPTKLWMFFVSQQNFSEKHNFFFDRLKRLCNQVLARGQHSARRNPHTVHCAKSS